MSYESEMRRQMEQAAAQEALEPQCPINDEVDAAFSAAMEKTHKYKGPAMKPKGARQKSMARGMHVPGTAMNAKRGTPPVKRGKKYGSGFSRGMTDGMPK